MDNKVSIVTAHNNDNNNEKNLISLIESLKKVTISGYIIEIIIVEILSGDESLSLLKHEFPDVKVIKIGVNNYVKAINSGINASEGEYIVILHDDIIIGENWLDRLLEVIQSDKRIGVVQSKILFGDEGKFESSGIEELENYYYHDIGFGEKDDLYDSKIQRINFFRECSVLIRKTCLDQVGNFDENFVNNMHDIDFSVRCRNMGWEIYLAPGSIVHHKYSGTAHFDRFEYYLSRNRFLLIAKHYPLQLAKSVKSSYFYQKNDLKNLYHSLIQATIVLVKYNKLSSVIQVLDELKEIVIEIFGAEKGIVFFSHLEAALKLRKIKIGIYDHAFHFAGGGQRYVAQLAEIFQNEYEITYIMNKDCDFLSYKEWFNIDLSNCKKKVIPIPFFEKLNKYLIDERMVINEKENPFNIISQESLNYDIFINANMLTKVNPRSIVSIFVCHFPDRDKEMFFQVDKYDYIFTNSKYTSFWLKKRWGLKSDLLLYPPVDMFSITEQMPHKEKIILSVARFEIGGTKKQLEMIQVFKELCTNEPQISKEWKLVLAGGAVPDSPYFEKIKREIASCQFGNILLKPNLTHSELKKQYQEASIFWHACGLGETSPHLIEHFGMTTVEAMQNFCVPIVIDGGGQREIVDHQINGFRFKTLDEMKYFTLSLINDENLRKKFAQSAFDKSKFYTYEIFKQEVTDFFRYIKKRIMGGELLEVMM